MGWIICQRVGILKVKKNQIKIQKIVPFNFVYIISSNKGIKDYRQIVIKTFTFSWLVLAFYREHFHSSQMGNR